MFSWPRQFLTTQPSAPWGSTQMLVTPNILQQQVSFPSLHHGGKWSTSRASIMQAGSEMPVERSSEKKIWLKKQASFVGLLTGLVLGKKLRVSQNANFHVRLSSAQSTQAQLLRVCANFWLKTKALTTSWQEKLSQTKLKIGLESHDKCQGATSMLLLDSFWNQTEF